MVSNTWESGHQIVLSSVPQGVLLSWSGTNYSLGLKYKWMTDDQDILTWEYKFSPNFCENSDGIWKKQNELEVTSPEEARQRTLLRPVSRHWIQSTERLHLYPNILRDCLLCGFGILQGVENIHMDWHPTFPSWKCMSHLEKLFFITLRTTKKWGPFKLENKSYHIGATFALAKVLAVVSGWVVVAALPGRRIRRHGFTSLLLSWPINSYVTLARSLDPLITVF